MKLNEEQLIKTLQEFYNQNDQSIQHFATIWTNSTTEYSYLLQYIYPENNDSKSIRGVLFALYFTFFLTRLCIPVSLDQYKYLHSQRDTLKGDVKSVLELLMKEEAFVFVPQPLYDYSLDYPFTNNSTLLDRVDVQEYRNRLNTFKEYFQDL